MKTVAIYGGGDWYDASCDIIEIDESASMDALLKEYNGEYLNSHYAECRKISRGQPWPKFYTFPEWLLKFKGAIKSNKVEEFWE